MDSEDTKIETNNIGNYDDDAIKHLDPMQHVRLRPGMYIGRTGDGSHQDDGIYILLKEIIDNSIDEFIMGTGKRVDIALEDGTVSIRDYGRGIPLSRLVDCVSQMNTGGKYNDDVFQFSIGLNGVGTKAVNALSSYFLVRSFRDGRFSEAVFECGVLKSQCEGETDEKNGVFVKFTPDNTIFQNYSYKVEYIEKRLWMYAYLNSGLSLYFNNQRYYSSKGLLDLLDNETGEDRLYDIIAYRSKDCEFALTHSDRYGETSFSFANGQFTHDGGTHLSAFREGVLKGINEYSGKNYKADDIRDGLIGAISVKVKVANFESQTKNKLGNNEIRGPVVAQVKDAVADFMHKHKDIADIILDKVARNESFHKQVQDAKKKSRDIGMKMRLRIPKLKDCKFHVGDSWPRKVEPKETMIFLTEGDSAAGSMEKCRDVDCQAIFALRGKPLNCYGCKKDKLYSNEELTFLTQALGIEEDIEMLRYDKVVIATDADVDGMHIRNLLITFFLTYFEQLVLSGHLYILETPLFRVKNTKENRYCYSEAERDLAAQALGKKAEITRFKGLGEISPEEFGPFIGKDIHLQPVTLDNMRNVDDMLGFFMGNNTPERKEYIMTHLEVSQYD